MVTAPVVDAPIQRENGTNISSLYAYNVALADVDGRAVDGVAHPSSMIELGPGSVPESRCTIL